MEKNIFEQPTVEIVIFDNEDIITASNPIIPGENEGDPDIA